MEEIRLMHSNGDNIAIKSGWPAIMKSYLIKDGLSYYAKVGAHDYILFQLRKIGPFSTWLTDYMFRKPITLSCEMISNGVEFHNMLEGAGMYSLNKGKTWRRECMGDHNILVNAPVFTVAAFTELPVRTFDIHVEGDYFAGFVEQYPQLHPLLDALEQNKTGAHYPTKAKSGLQLRYQLSQIIRLYMEAVPSTKSGRMEQEAVITRLIENSLALIASPPPKTPSSYSFLQTDIENLAGIKEFITENLIHPEVLKMATQKYYISGEKLLQGFKILFGMRPKEFLIQQRVERVKKFIIDAPEATHLEIAMSVGYTDGAYLSQLFLRKEGMRIEEFKQHYKKQ